VIIIDVHHRNVFETNQEIVVENNQSLKVNEAPQEQPFSALGLRDILNADRISSSWYSTVDPFKYSSDTSSTTTFAPSLSIILKHEQQHKISSKIC